MRDTMNNMKEEDEFVELKIKDGKDVRKAIIDSRLQEKVPRSAIIMHNDGTIEVKQKYKDIIRKHLNENSRDIEDDEDDTD